MPFGSERPIVRVEPASMHTIDTTNVVNLFMLWSVFSKCSTTMEDGKRLENFSWRLWNRETFCCAPDQKPNFKERWSLNRSLPSSSSSSKRLHGPSSLNQSRSSEEAPELSSSVESLDSDAPAQTPQALSSPIRPELRRLDSSESRSRGFEKHITPVDLEKIVTSIKEKKELEPLSPLPLPRSCSIATMQKPAVKPSQPSRQTMQSIAESTTQRDQMPSNLPPDSSTSTVATEAYTDGSNLSPPVPSDSSSTTEMTDHSVTIGFSPGQAVSSYRSGTQALPKTILKNTDNYKAEGEQFKKKPGFIIGASSDEGGESSLETHMSLANRSSLAEGLKRPTFNRKQTSFRDEIVTRAIYNQNKNNSDSALESDDEDEESMSESAIEDDEDENDWEDSDMESGPSSLEEKNMFKRVDSRPNLTSRRSLLTTLMHEGDRAAALQQAATRQPHGLRRSRTSSPNGPSIATSPKAEPSVQFHDPQQEPDIPRSQSRPIIITTSNTHQPALSPRTTRRNMLSTELTESLRKHLLWERQQKNATSSAVLKRRHTSNDVKNLRNYPGESHHMVTLKETKPTNSFNAYFDNGLQEYHERGW
ncbi:DUF1752-domain-containing protein [Patellaria atrata CBS 101060]|uniref:DUF1752-domain-containing protein n=1 Tax=Patellaria atrata CBS 101060 TaxID=1346257 RepID=A0A9P4VRH3_9PEZI|nr:DUF1752-domain-containing protein [Patellaria atrata CBS 101060]